MDFKKQSYEGLLFPGVNYHLTCKQTVQLYYNLVLLCKLQQYTVLVTCHSKVTPNSNLSNSCLREI